ncbi:hypothetical protein B0I35DRAFT_214495 [Stachybotrys elegans]|uniref:Uncharacterized protein n=1 Tax=Stachybotrys elegans TaxID=80388 RepID=A0A8K0SAP5_9HYPO|nr:hypothetical protein B0I35DRAFT_214495 [Stachybotrys elegans]
MAKFKPTLQEMESALGYVVDPVVDVGHRVYSDLTPVSDDPYDRTEMEFRELRKLQRTRYQGNSSVILPVGDEMETISGPDNTVIISQSNLTGFYKFFVDIQYGFGLHVSFLLTEAETYDVASTTKLWQAKLLREDYAKSTSQQPLPAATRYHTAFLGLPREIRDKIYGFAFQGANWRSEERNYNVCQAIGDPSGFFFPLDHHCTLLRVNRQIRQEALPLAFRHTTFYLTTIEDVTRLLIAIGHVGRENIETLDFLWESAIDHDLNWRKFPESETNHLILPTRHVSACVQLLKQCGRLRSLRLKFERYMMEDVPGPTFMADPGILSLCSIRVERVEISNPDEESLDEHSIVHWLKDKMTRQDSGDVH